VIKQSLIGQLNYQTRINPPEYPYHSIRELKDVEDDHDALVKEFPFYDALYAYFKRGLIIEKHKVEYEALKSRGERTAFIKEKRYAK